MRRNSVCLTFPHCLIVKKMLWQWVHNSVNTLRTLFEVIDHAERSIEDTRSEERRVFNRARSIEDTRSEERRVFNREGLY